MLWLSTMYRTQVDRRKLPVISWQSAQTSPVTDANEMRLHHEKTSFSLVTLVKNYAKWKDWNKMKDCARDYYALFFIY